MKITNKTNYDTQYVRKLFLACEKHEGTSSKYREVEVKKSRGRYVRGRAWTHSRFVDMYLRKNAQAESVAKV